MKKRKVVKSRGVHKTHRASSARSYALGGGRKQIWGIDHDFILIVGGGFVLIVLGLMLLH